MLALLPVDPRAESSAAASHPSTAARNSGSRRSRAANPSSSRSTAKRRGASERVQLVELAEPVDPVAGRCAPRDDEPVLFEIAQHPRRPAGRAAAAPTVSPSRANLSTKCQCSPWCTRAARTARAGNTPGVQPPSRNAIGGPDSRLTAPCHSPAGRMRRPAGTGRVGRPPLRPGSGPRHHVAGPRSPRRGASLWNASAHWNSRVPTLCRLRSDAGPAPRLRAGASTAPRCPSRP